jgi:phosphinothricin acetyltransferase
MLPITITLILFISSRRQFMNNISIRPALFEDIQQILDIYNHAVDNTTATFDINHQTLEQRIQWFEKLSSTHPIIVATVNDQIAGYASLSPFREKEAYKQTAELSVYVHENYRGYGIATSLINNLLDVANNFNIKTIISVITTGNESSVHIHNKLGFKYMGTLTAVGYKFDKWLDVDFYQFWK